MVNGIEMILTCQHTGHGMKQGQDYNVDVAGKFVRVEVDGEWTDWLVFETYFSAEQYGKEQGVEG